MAQFRQVRWSLDDLDVEIAPEAQVTRQAEELEDNKAQASQDTAQYEENVTSLNRIQRQTSSTISVPQFLLGALFCSHFSVSYWPQVRVLEGQVSVLGSHLKQEPGPQQSPT